MATAESLRRGRKAVLASPSGAGISGPSRCGPSRPLLGWVTAPLLKPLLPISPRFLPTQSTPSWGLPPECAQNREVPTSASGQVFAVCPSGAKVGPSSDKRVPAKKRKTSGDFSGPQRYWEASTALCGFCLHTQLGRTHSQGLPTQICVPGLGTHMCIYTGL